MVYNFRHRLCEINNSNAYGQQNKDTERSISLINDWAWPPNTHLSWAQFNSTLEWTQKYLHTIILTKKKWGAYFLHSYFLLLLLLFIAFQKIHSIQECNEKCRKQQSEKWYMFIVESIHQLLFYPKRKWLVNSNLNDT